jgi:monovalent cation:H+ antiporter-2, CPA2 family
VQDQRDQRYNLLRGYFHGADDDTADEAQQERLETVVLPQAARAAERPLGHFALHAMGVRVVTIKRNGQDLAVADDTLLQGSDALVLCGKPEALGLANEKLMKSGAA